MVLSQREIWPALLKHLSTSDWTPLHEIYALVERETKPSPNDPPVRWQRNIRNVLQDERRLETWSGTDRAPIACRSLRAHKPSDSDLLDFVRQGERVRGAGVELGVPPSAAERAADKRGIEAGAAPTDQIIDW